MYWKNKSLTHTLEYLVKNFADVLKEFANRIKEEPVSKQEEIYIHYKPNVELVVFIDGNRIESQDTTREQFEKLCSLRNENNTKGIIDLLTQEVKEEENNEEQEIEEIIKNVHLLVETGDFDVIGNSVYMKGIDRSLPKDMVDYFVDNKTRRQEFITNEECQIIDEEYEALKNFWYWVTLNPKPQVADLLFTFLRNNFLRLNKNGFFYALRNVVTVAENTKLVQFISEQYIRVKGWKKNPGKYIVWQKDITEIVEEEGYYGDEWDEDTDEYVQGDWVEGESYEKVVGVEYSIHKEGVTPVGWKIVDTLQALYERLPEMEENRYTDAHTHTFDIRIGKKVWMDPKECNWSTVDCGKSGLHFAMDHIKYVGCGDTSVIILINPSKVVGIGEHKGRCYEYLPISTIPTEQATAFLQNGAFHSTEIEIKEYEEEMKTLRETVERDFVIEKERHSFDYFPFIDADSVDTAINQLEQRVQTIS